MSQQLDSTIAIPHSAATADDDDAQSLHSTQPKLNLNEIPSPPSSHCSSSSEDNHPPNHMKRPLSSSPNSDQPTARPSKRIRTTQQRYYLKGFNFIIQHVLKRYSDILSSVDVDLVRVMRSASISENALALFVRLYRRQQPQWFRVDKLRDDYRREIDVESAIYELVTHSLLMSSKFASQATKPQPLGTYSSDSVLLVLARQVLPSLSLPECKAVCSSIADGVNVRKQSKNLLLPSLKQILSTEIDERSGLNSSDKQRFIKFKQSTLSGLSPADCLSKAILKKAGHCVRIPINVLKTIRRIHFLFFLEDGHDSPNVTLADTQKVKFPRYKCDPSELIFLSARGFEDYEEAVALEQELSECLEEKKYEKAAYFGSIAELEIREFFKMKETGTGRRGRPENVGEDEGYVEDRYNGEYGWLTNIAYTQRQYVCLEAETQLRHPFFKRFTAIWVYVRACWYSVQALERLGEYESAIKRLKLLLDTSLMPRRRGNCLNRLTINLERHVKRADEALQVIVDALHPDAPKLNFGDRLQLASRGAAVHRRLYKRTQSQLEVENQKRSKAKAKRRVSMPTLQEIVDDRLKVISDVLNEMEVEIAVQKIYGQSIQQRDRERVMKGRKERDDGGNDDDNDEITPKWLNRLRFDSSVSLSSTVSMDQEERLQPVSAIMGKSMFRSFRDNKTPVSVEDYCLQWYSAQQGWNGIHDEGSSIRFLFCLLMWEQAVFAKIPDVFQTPYQDRPLDLMTESFYESRKAAIDERIIEMHSMSSAVLYQQVIELYERYDGTRAVGCIWDRERYPPHMLACVAAGLGSNAMAMCCALLCCDYSYWASGLPDLTLWRSDDDEKAARLVEVKSARDNLSDKQKAWLFQLTSSNADCQVCKVIDRVTANNATELEQSRLSYQALSTLRMDLNQQQPTTLL